MITRAQSKKQEEKDALAANPGRWGLGYDEDGVSNSPYWGGGGLTLRAIEHKLMQLEEHPDPKYYKKAQHWDNPFEWHDGCCIHPISTYEAAKQQWERAVAHRLEVIAAEKRPVRSHEVDLP